MLPLKSSYNIDIWIVDTYFERNIWTYISFSIFFIQKFHLSRNIKLFFRCNSLNVMAKVFVIKSLSWLFKKSSVRICIIFNDEFTVNIKTIVQNPSKNFIEITLIIAFLQYLYIIWKIFFSVELWCRKNIEVLLYRFPLIF